MGGALSQQEQRAYDQDGVLFPIQALTSAEVALFRTHYERLEQRLGSDGRLTGHQASQWHLHLRWAYDLATHPRVLDAIEDLIGPDILVHSSTFFSKPPHDPSYVSWHQDGHYWGLSRPRLASAWIALRESTALNGCLRVVPGSHAGAAQPHAATSVSQDNLLGSGLEIKTEVDEQEARDVLLEAGEMSCHHVYIVHGSKPNRSDSQRIGFAVRYLAPEVQQQTWHHEVVLARGQDSSCHYRHWQQEPCDDFEAGIAQHAAFARRLAEIRRAGGRPSG